MQVVGEAKNGDLSGEIGVLCHRPQLFTVRTKRLSQLLRLNRTTFFNIIQSNVEDGTIVMNNLLQVCMLGTLRYCSSCHCLLSSCSLNFWSRFLDEFYCTFLFLFLCWLALEGPQGSNHRECSDWRGEHAGTWSIGPASQFMLCRIERRWLDVEPTTETGPRS